ncbi:MAG: CHAT domain-containing protein [Saprospiraceae bacterium]|nr:CHAT domain-containing protein [Saprospiraceae bacterium]
MSKASPEFLYFSIPMQKPAYIFFILVFLISSQSRAQCPDKELIDSYYENNDIPGFMAFLPRMDSCKTTSEFRGYVFHQLSRTYFDLEDLESALLYIRQAYEIRQEVLASDDPDLGRTLYLYGLIYSKLADYPQAEKYLNEAVTVFRKKQDQLRALMIVQKEIANIAVAKGDFDKADEILSRNIELAIENADPLRQADYLLDLANVRLSQKRPAEALTELDKALGLYKANQTGSGFKKENLASCYLNIAFAYDELKQSAKALENYRLAIMGYRAIGADSEEAKCHANQSLTLIRLGRTTEAARELDQAERLAKSAGNIELLAQIFDNRGDLFLARKEPVKALGSYQLAVQQLTPGWTPVSDLDYPSAEMVMQTAFPEHLLNHLFDKVQCLERCRNLIPDSLLHEVILPHYFQLAALINGMRYGQRVQASKLFWRALVRPIYEAAVRQAHQDGNLEAAFYFMEQSKSMLLLDALEENRARREMNPADARREREMRASLDNMRGRLINVSADHRPVLMDSLLQLQQKWEVYQDSLALIYPGFAAHNLAAQHNDPEEIRGLLGTAHWLLIEYMLGDSALYIWSMGPFGEYALRAIPVSEVTERLDAYLTQLGNGNRRFDPEAYAKQANYLYTVLLQPELEVHPEADRLLLIPDGSISFIPFDALMSQSNWDPDNFLVQRYLTRFAYSAEVLARQQQRGLQSGEVLTIAPVFDPSLRQLDPLKQSKEMVAQLSIKGMRVLLEEDATADAFIQYAASSSVINLVTHATAGSDAIPKVEFYDRSMLLPEMYSLQIQADLVILAACETGLGDVRKGEGAMSLSRGFTYAGASSLIASLWSVDQSSTQDVFCSFYTNLQDGMTKSEALWEAKRAYLSHTNIAGTNPYYWAGFVFFGADNTLQLPAGSYWDPCLLGLVLGVGLIFGGAWLKRRRQKAAE